MDTQYDGEITPAPNLLVANWFQSEEKHFAVYAGIKGGQQRPEIELLHAALRNGIQEYLRLVRFRLGRTGVQRDHAKELAKWVESTDLNWIFSFDSLCGVAGLDPSAVRKEIKGANRQSFERLMQASYAQRGERTNKDYDHRAITRATKMGQRKGRAA